MPSPDWEDLAEFFDPAEFAQTARLWRDGANLGEITGIYDNPTERKELGDYTQDEMAARFLCREPGGLNAKRGDVLEVGTEYFDVIEKPVRDGTGLVTLELSEPTDLAPFQDGASYLIGAGGAVLTDEDGNALEDG